MAKKNKKAKAKVQWIRLNDELRACIDGGNVILRRTDNGDTPVPFKDVLNIDDALSKFLALNITGRDVRIVGERCDFVRVGCQVIARDRITELSAAIREAQAK